MQDVAVSHCQLALGHAVRGHDGGTRCGDAIAASTCRDGSIVFAVVDVMGRGSPLAAQSYYLANYLVSLLTFGRQPAYVLEATDRLLRRRFDMLDPTFVSAFIGRIDVERRRLLYASAGHETALLHDGSGNFCHLAPTGPVLGVTDEGGFVERRISFIVVHRLVVVTDGITEARNAQGEFFGSEGVLAASRRHAGASQAVDGIFRAASRHARSELRDDAGVFVATWQLPGY